MTVYRSDEEAGRCRREQLEAELAALRIEERTLSAELSATEAEASTLEARLVDVGPGGGPAGVVRDRIGMATMVLVLASVALLPLHLIWHRFLATDLQVVPPIAMLAVPGAIAAFVARPYRAENAECRAAFWLGWACVAGTFLHIVLGRLG